MMTEVHDAGRPAVLVTRREAKGALTFACSSSSSSWSCYHHHHLLTTIFLLLMVSSSSLITFASAEPPADLNDDDDDDESTDGVHRRPVDAKSSSEALLNFKTSLTSSNKEVLLANWVATTSPCTGDNENWVGVLCYQGDVWGLQLEDLELSGEIDVDSLLPLHFLRTLSFMNNNFKGAMPNWNKLVALKSLYLSNNSFSGEIPHDAFNGMKYLKKLYLADNQFTGNIPTSLATSCPRLFELRLENNRFTGSIPPFPPNVLKLLNVSNNQLQGPIPPALSSMDPTTFSGNKGLCGKPLESACISPSPSPNPSPEANPNGLNSMSSPGQSSEKSPSLISRIMLIVGICLVILALVIVLIVVIRYRRHRSTRDPPLGRVVDSNNSIHDQGDNTSVDMMMSKSHVSNNNVNKAAATHEQPAPPPAVAAAGKLSFVRDDRERFDLQDLLRASAEVLGSGNLGSSYKAILMDGQAVVVKRFKQMNHVAKEDFHEHMRRLGRLCHPNLLPLVAYYYRKEEKLLVYDYASNGSLASHLHGNHSKLDWSSRLKIIKGVAKALAYLHNELPSLALPHGHLKSSNVLLDKYFNPVLMDYTLVPLLNATQVQHLLVAYKAPEYAQQGQGGRVTRKSDVWSLGILILETLTGKLPTNYLALSTGYGTELATWVDTIIKENESAFDKDMNSTKDNEQQIRELFNIGVACCQEDLDTRWDLKEAVENIQGLKDN